MLDEIKIFIQFIERGSVENVRARLRAIEYQHADLVVANLTPNHRGCSNCRH